MGRIENDVCNARAARLSAVLVMVIAFGAMAHAAKAHMAKGELALMQTTEVAGVTLPPGNYMVREVKTAEGPMVEFVRTVHNEQASELVQADEEEVVAKVKASPRALERASEDTKLQVASGQGSAKALEIRGANVEFVFGGDTTDSMAAK
jgi:hypothetical protein